MKKLLLILSAFAVVTVIGGRLLRAQQANSQLRSKFDAFDSNKDGVLTSSEVPSKLFASLDLDNDGRVPPKEALQAVRKMGEGATNESPAASKEPGPLPPAIRKPGEMGIGRLVEDVTMTDLEGKSLKMSALAKKGKGLVVAYTSATCPVSKRYLPVLVRLADDLARQGIALVLVNPLASDSAEQIRAQLGNLKSSSTVPYIRDTSYQLSRALEATTTTEVFFIDSTRTLVYRGALDDQYGVNYSLDAPRQRYLQEAIRDHLAGRMPLIAATEAPGCELDVPTAAKSLPATAITYHQHVSRILQQNCVECHHDGGMAPFSLDEPTEVIDRAKTILRVVSDGTMPPWFADEETAKKHNIAYSNDRSLSKADRESLVTWLRSTDKPLGPLSDAPVPLSFDSSGWTHGAPDLVVGFAKPQRVKAEGKMPYANVTVETGITEDKWLQGYQILPGAKEVVHHALVFVIDPAKGRVENFREQDGFFAAYVPGGGTERLPAGFAKKLPAGARLRFQMHYTPNGTATDDLTRIGFYFATQPPVNEVHVASVVNTRFAIPAGVANHEVIAQRSIPSDVHVMSFLPHMHVRGKAFRYEVDAAEGTRTLLDIPRYDFNWQLQYNLSQPLLLKKGTKLRGIAHYDNSSANPANPDPSKIVKWGPQTEDEMMIGYITYYLPL
ncbi:MAG: redoxin domain-containing protein [Verrucomicrobiaceae bacterium]|nr:redoxin domain-containing protein [Verrucomicrobiaceae bacterium]